MIVDDGLANRLADFLVHRCVRKCSRCTSWTMTTRSSSWTSTPNAAAGAGIRLAWLCAGGLFDVAGIVVPAAHDDQVFETPGDEQVAVPQESEIARPQVFASPVRRRAARANVAANVSRVASACPQ